MSTAWLSRYEVPRPIRVHGPFQFFATRSLGGEARLVIVGAPATDRATAADRLDRVSEAHSLVDHPKVPRLAERDCEAGVEFAAFVCDAVLDGETLLAEVARRGERVAYAAADAFISGLRDVLRSAHRVHHPVTGEALCLGSMSTDHLFFSADGRHHVVGFGADLTRAASTGFVPPEVAIGGRPTPEGDFVALLLFMRFLLPYVELPPPIARCLRGEPEPSDAEIAAVLFWFERNVIGVDAKHRASVDEALEKSAHLRRLLGVELDAPAFDAFVGRVCRGHVPSAAAVPDAHDRVRSDPSAKGLVVGPRAEWFTAAAGKVDLRPHAALRRILEALLDLHHRTPDRSATVGELCDAGWPGERMTVDAGKARVYVALSTLRRMGLRDPLERADGGYRLKPTLRVDRDPESEP